MKAEIICKTTIYQLDYRVSQFPFPELAQLRNVLMHTLVEARIARCRKTLLGKFFRQGIWIWDESSVPRFQQTLLHAVVSNLCRLNCILPSES